MQKPLPELPTALLPQTQRAPVAYRLTAQRVHDLAIQRWLNRNFHVADGYSIPVVFATPKDAYSEFINLWKDGTVFKHLLDIRDGDGKQVYEPYPSNPRYPLISVKRRGAGYSAQRSFSLHTRRRAYYVSVADQEPITIESVGTVPFSRRELANVVQTQYPAGWDFKYQIDHYSTRPDTQNAFTQQLFAQLKTGGGSAQAWIPVAYPTWFGQDQRHARIVLEGDVQDLTPEDAPEDSPVEYRTSINVTVEGFSPDLDMTTYPVLWQLVLGHGAADAGAVEKIYTRSAEDLRTRGDSVVFNSLNELPKQT